MKSFWVTTEYETPWSPSEIVGWRLSEPPPPTLGRHDQLVPKPGWSLRWARLRAPAPSSVNKLLRRIGGRPEAMAARQAALIRVRRGGRGVGKVMGTPRDAATADCGVGPATTSLDGGNRNELLGPKALRLLRSKLLLGSIYPSTKVVKGHCG